ncbi:MAG: hypothetical protein ABW328_20015 [Ilumatobacteraceae bacterium]
MANFFGESDAAVEQLYDELMARAWAIHGVLGAAATDVTRADVAARLAAVALSHVSGLATGGVDADVALDAVLWPAAGRPVEGDPWWSTPLGQLVSKTPRERAATRDQRPGGVTPELVAS